MNMALEIAERNEIDIKYQERRAHQHKLNGFAYGVLQAAIDVMVEDEGDREAFEQGKEAAAKLFERSNRFDDPDRKTLSLSFGLQQAHPGGEGAWTSIYRVLFGLECLFETNRVIEKPLIPKTAQDAIALLAEHVGCDDIECIFDAAHGCVRRGLSESALAEHLEAFLLAHGRKLD